MKDSNAHSPKEQAGIPLGEEPNGSSDCTPEELSPELAAIDRRARKQTCFDEVTAWARYHNGEGPPPPREPRKPPKKRKAVEEKDRWFHVYAWMVRAFPRQLAAAVLGSDLVNKFLQGARGEPPAARSWFKFQGRRIRAWRCGDVYRIGQRMGGWSRYRVLRAVESLNRKDGPVRIGLALGKAVYLRGQAWKLYCGTVQEEHKRVERERRRQRDRISEAKWEPGIEASPVMSSVMYRESQATRLRRKDVVRCEGNLTAALVLAQIRAKIKYYHQDEIFLRDEDLSSATGLSISAVQDARAELRRLKLISARRKRRGRTGNWVVYHYTLHPGEER